MLRFFPLIIEFQHRKWNMWVCVYVGHRVCQGDISRGYICSINTNISPSMCFTTRCFVAGVCKRSGMLLKFDTTLCSPVCLHHAFLLPLIIFGSAVFKREEPPHEYSGYQVLLDTVKIQKLWRRALSGPSGVEEELD